MKSCVFQTALRLQVIAVAGAICFAAPPTVASAQGATGEKAQSSAAASKPHSVPGVVVKPAPKVRKVPPDKKAAFDAEAAKRKAWTTYRTTTPTAPSLPTAAATAPATTSAAARAENYPGLANQAGR